MERDRIELDGQVVSMNKGVFMVDIATGDELENLIKCKLSGKIIKNSIRVLVDDIVKIEVTPYDPSMGRIIHRYKK